MEKLLIIGSIITVICLVWMHIQTKKRQTNDKTVWMVLAFLIPVPAVLIFYFTQMRNKTNEI